MPPTGLSGAALNRARAAALKLMPDTWIVQPPLRLPDGAGGWSETFPTSGEMPCRVDPMNPLGVDVVAAREASVSRFKLTVPWDKVLIVGQQGQHNGFTYEIRELKNDQTPVIYRQAIIERVDG
jgi:hypothetical protein